MNYTQNYHLPQWEKTDRIVMEDFNSAMASLETGVAGAQSTADTALGKANAAYAPDQKPYVVGSYTGTGQTMTIELGFRPSFLIISGAVENYPATVETHAASGIQTAGNVLKRAVTFTDSGFTINKYPSTEYPRLLDCKVYDYIAFG